MLHRSVSIAAGSHCRQCTLDIIYRQLILRRVSRSSSCRLSQFSRHTPFSLAYNVRCFGTTQWLCWPSVTPSMLAASSVPVAKRLPRAPAAESGTDANAVLFDVNVFNYHTCDDSTDSSKHAFVDVPPADTRVAQTVEPARKTVGKRKNKTLDTARERVDRVLAIKPMSTKELSERSVNTTRHQRNDAVIDLPEVVAMQQSHVLRHSRFLLRSFVHMCTETGLFNRAYHHVQRVRKIAAPAGLAGNADLRVYNALLRACAKQCDNARIYEVTRWIAEDGLVPDVYTFAHWLECVGRDALRIASAGGRIEKEQDAVRVTLQQMERHNLRPIKIFQHCRFVHDEREMILHAIRLVRPEFEVSSSSDGPSKSSSSTDNYRIPLLTPLNDKTYRVQHATPDGSLESPYAGVFSSHEALVDRFREQMQRELAGRVELRSVFCDQPHMRLHASEQARIEVETDTWRERAEQELALDAKIQQQRRQVEHYRDVFTQMKHDWHVALTSYLARERNLLINAPQVSRKPSVDPYMLALAPEELAQVLVDELVQIGSFSPSYSPGLFTLEHQLGAIVMRRFMARLKAKCGVWQALDELAVKYFDYFLTREQENDAGLSSLNHRQYWQKLCRQVSSGASPSMAEVEWPREVKFELGRRLYEILIEANVVMVNDDVLRKRNRNGDVPHLLPAVFTIHRRSATGVVSVQVKPNPKLAKLIKLAENEYLTFDVQNCPMLAPPHPWTTQTSGGYFLTPTSLTRLPEQSRMVRSVVDLARPQQLHATFDALNILGASPWRVNTDMLDLLIGIFNHGGMPELGIPSPASSELLVSPSSQIPTLTPEQKQRQLQKEKAEMHALWCEALYKLSIAHHLRDRIFFLPHNMDFRGRVYPVAPHLSQMGNDATRSLMLFAKGRPLGPHGFDWLKIHCINLTGVKKKEPTRERLRYANEIMSDILDSAERPLTGRGWWKQSDDPWQTLACCKEIRKIITSGVAPEDYVCHFPIHQDGSCNGLQHYAALGRDQLGAESVNLCPNTKPQDVYSRVAALAEARRADDAAGGSDIAQALAGFIQRKVVKQTVMTIVYGVTSFGAKTQIQGQLLDMPEFPAAQAPRAAQYLAQITFASIGEIFHSARHIQEWLTRSARDIARIRGMPVEWRTPLGLPVSQPYFKYAVPNYHTTRAFASVRQACSYKQANAMPPNYIHSLDSTHMMLTALYCHRANLSFVSVHDSFWTHPSTIESMGRILREQFVALHEKPLLDNLSRSFVDQYTIDDLPAFDFSKAMREGNERLIKRKKAGGSSSNKMSEDLKKLTTAQRKLHAQHTFNRLLTDVPAKGKFNLQQVLKSEFFFS